MLVSHLIKKVENGKWLWWFLQYRRKIKETSECMDMQMTVSKMPCRTRRWLEYESSNSHATSTNGKGSVNLRQILLTKNSLQSWQSDIKSRECISTITEKKASSDSHLNRIYLAPSIHWQGSFNHAFELLPALLTKASRMDNIDPTEKAKRKNMLRWEIMFSYWSTYLSNS